MYELSHPSDFYSSSTSSSDEGTVNLETRKPPIITSTTTVIDKYDIEDDLNERFASLKHEKELLTLENTNLKLEVEIVRREIVKLSEYEKENEMLRNELNALRAQNGADFDRLSGKLENEMRAREECYRERDELKRTHQVGLNLTSLSDL